MSYFNNKIKKCDLKVVGGRPDVARNPNLVVVRLKNIYRPSFWHILLKFSEGCGLIFSECTNLIISNFVVLKNKESKKNYQSLYFVI